MLYKKQDSMLIGKPYVLQAYPLVKPCARSTIKLGLPGLIFLDIKHYFVTKKKIDSNASMGYRLF